MIGLYAHIPFCVTKCHYCNFVVTPGAAVAQKDRFIELFEKEARYYSRDLKRRKFDTLYLGGGTPSALADDQVEKVFGILRRNFCFKKGIEVTCEVNPGDVSLRKARLLRTLGVNRVSLGAQTFHDRTLKELNRAHDAQGIVDSFTILRAAGFKNISLDLILSLPGQSLEDVKVSLEKAAGLGPEHVSLYELVIEQGTVFGRRHKEGKLSLPEENTQLEMLSFARGYLTEHGFKHYELLNYARPGYESRHNILYWDNQEYLGLGPAAFSYIKGRRYRNSLTVNEYTKKMDSGDWSPSEEEFLSDEKKDIESFLLALRLGKGADAKKFRKVTEKMRESIRDLSEKGLIRQKAGRIALTGRGQFFAETVFSELSSP